MDVTIPGVVLFDGRDADRRLYVAQRLAHTETLISGLMAGGIACPRCYHNVRKFTSTTDPVQYPLYHALGTSFNCSLCLDRGSDFIRRIVDRKYLEESYNEQYFQIAALREAFLSL